MNKLIDFLKAKSFEMAITSISVCLVVVVSAGAIVHSNNKKLEAVLNELSNSSTTESVTESSSETTTESTTTVSTTEKKKNITTTTEPAGDKTIQYLAEYERITKEYEKKRAELEGQTLLETTIKISDYLSEEEKSSIYEANSIAVIKSEKAKSAISEIKKLDEQYKKDIEQLKREYGIIK